MARTFTKWPYDIRNILQNVSLQGPPKYTQIVISGLKIYFLEFLVSNVNAGLKSRHSRFFDILEVDVATQRTAFIPKLSSNVSFHEDAE
jgi:hypothetical protein